MFDKQEQIDRLRVDLEYEQKQRYELMSMVWGLSSKLNKLGKLCGVEWKEKPKAEYWVKVPESLSVETEKESVE